MREKVSSRGRYDDCPAGAQKTCPIIDIGTSPRIDWLGDGGIKLQILYPLYPLHLLLPRYYAARRGYKKRLINNSNVSADFVIKIGQNFEAALPRKNTRSLYIYDGSER